MPQIVMKDLLEAGVHFGHQTKRWNPKMKPYVYGARNGIYIIDLQKTLGMARDAVDFAKKLSERFRQEIQRRESSRTSGRLEPQKLQLPA